MEKKASVSRRFRELGKDIFTYGLMSGVSSAIGIILLPLLTRVLSVEQYGAIDTIAVVTTFLVAAMKVSLPSALARYFNDPQDFTRQRRLASTLMIFSIPFSLSLVIIASLFADTLSSMLLKNPSYGQFVQIGCWIALFQGLSALPMMLLRLERRIVTYGIVTLAETVIGLVFTLGFVFGLQMGVIGVFSAQLATGLLVLLIAMFFTRKYYALQLSRYDLSRSLKYGAPLAPTVLITWLSRQSDRIVLLSVLGLSGVAVFGAATRLSGVMEFVLLAFRQAWQPFSLLLVKAPERNEVYRRAFTYYAGGFACFGLMLTAVAPEIIAILLPVEYHSGYDVIPWAVGATVLHQSAMFTNLGLMVNEKTARVTMASAIAVPVSVGLALLLIPPFGVSGAAIGTFIAEVIFTSLLWRFSVRHSSVRFDTRRIIVVFLTYVIGAVLLLVVVRFFPSPQSIAIRMGLLVLLLGLIGTQSVDPMARGFLTSLPSKMLALRRQLVRPAL